MSSQPVDNVLVLHARDLHTDAVADDHIGAHQLTIEADITYRQLDYWTRLGFLRPCTAPEPGSGYVRVYPRDQIPLAREMRRVLAAGITTPMSLVHHLATELLATGSAQLGEYTLTPNPRQEQQP